MKSTFRFLVALILLAAGLPFVSHVAPAQAQGGSLTPGTPTTGTLAGSEATYTLDAAAGQLLLISVESDAFDSTVALKDASGADLASDDDGGQNGNALLAYVAQADGGFQVVVNGWSDPNGDYTLTAEVIDPTVVQMGGTVSLAPEGRSSVYTVFAGTADSVVNVWANTAGEDDIRVELIGVDANLIESDDDDGPGRNALLRRVVLPADGLYLVAASAIFEDIPTANVDVTVEATERLFLDAAPQGLTLSDDDLGTEVYTFEAAVGTTYRITVTSANATGVSLDLFDTGEFFDPDIESGSATRITWDYLATASGLFRVNVHPSFFSDGDTYQISVEVVQ